MGSDSDLHIMKEASVVLNEFNIPHEIKIVSAHRTPAYMFDFAQNAEQRGIKVIIALLLPLFCMINIVFAKSDSINII